MPRCDRRLRGVKKPVAGLWPPPKTLALCLGAVHAASDRQLQKILKRLAVTPATQENRFRRLALHGAIMREIDRRLVGGDAEEDANAAGISPHAAISETSSQKPN